MDKVKLNKLQKILLLAASFFTFILTVLRVFEQFVDLKERLKALEQMSEEKVDTYYSHQ